MKSITSLERVFHVDIVERTKKDFELILHFVNEKYDKMGMPVIKRYLMNIDEKSEKFLHRLEFAMTRVSKFYQPK